VKVQIAVSLVEETKAQGFVAYTRGTLVAQDRAC
jgi:hypothetical protein